MIANLFQYLTHNYSSKDISNLKCTSEHLNGNNISHGNRNEEKNSSDHMKNGTWKKQERRKFIKLFLLSADFRRIGFHILTWFGFIIDLNWYRNQNHFIFHSFYCTIKNSDILIGTRLNHKEIFLPLLYCLYDSRT